MSEELKPCPFCGKPFEMLVNRDGSAIYKHDSDDCVMRRDDLTGWVWYNPETLISDLNTHPVEDALRAEIARLNVQIEKLASLVKEVDAADLAEMYRADWQMLCDERKAKDNEIAELKHIRSTMAETIVQQEAELRQAREALRSIAQSDPVVVDGKEWRMERKDAIDRAAAALLELLKEE